MVRILPYSLLAFTVLFFLALGFVLIDPIGVQLQHRNAQRQKDVASILDRIEMFAKRNRSLPPFTPNLQQIGSAESGCTLNVSSCQITSEACLNIHSLMDDRNLSLPSDLSIGSYYKTGYAVKIDPGTAVVTVIACGAEEGASLSASRSMREHLKPVEDTLHVKK